MKAEARDYRTLGVLWILYGFLRAIAVAGILAYSGTLALMWGALLARVPDPLMWMTVFHVWLVLLVAWCIISAFFSFVAGVTLIKALPPARMDTLVAALLALPDLPIGIVLGVYTIAALLPRTPAVQQRPQSQPQIVIPLASPSSR